MKRYCALDLAIATIVIATILAAVFTARVWLPRLGAAYLIADRGMPDATYQMVNTIALHGSAIAFVECQKVSAGKVIWLFHLEHGKVVRVVTHGSGVVPPLNRTMPVVQSFMENPQRSMVHRIEVYVSSLFLYNLFANRDGKIVGYCIVYKD
ncbi:MAG: hypothetical protein ACK4ME_07650 [Fimbriimonadales bacterium]